MEEYYDPTVEKERKAVGGGDRARGLKRSPLRITVISPLSAWERV